MRLFKCFDPFCIDEYTQCLGIWAENEQKALRKMASIQSELDLYENPYNTVMETFKIKEHYPAHDCDVYACYQKDMSYESDCHFVFVPFDVKDHKEYIMDKLAEYESEEEHFMEFICDPSINCSFAEMFYRDNKGYIFEPSLNFDGSVDVREDIKVRVLEENKSIPKYIDELFIENVTEFFGENEDFRDEYLSYIYAGDKPFFDYDFYKFVARRLIDLGKWTAYDIHLVNIFAE